MSTTTENQQNTQPGVLRAALVALTSHMAECHLPVPIGIELPTPTQPPYVRVRVAPISAQQAWIDSARLDGQDVEEVTVLGERMVFHLHLPDTGTRVELVGLRDADVKRLQAVSA